MPCACLPVLVLQHTPYVDSKPLCARALHLLARVLPVVLVRLKAFVRACPAPACTCLARCACARALHLLLRALPVPARVISLAFG